jgi:hypothetical protein
MAKRGILEHEKTLMLADQLGIMEPFAVGILEVFWQWVAKYHPQGDITGVRPRLMASAIRYRDDADTLWLALIACGFIDDLYDGRFIVHDWSDHAENSVHKYLKDRGLSFANGVDAFSRTKPKPKNVVTESQQVTTESRLVTTESEKVVAETRLPLPLPLPLPLKNNTLTLSSPGIDEGDCSNRSPTDEEVLAPRDDMLPPMKRKMRQQRRAAVRRLFTYYLERTERNPKLYTLTLARMDKGISRLEDCQRKCDGDLIKAEALMGIAIDALLASDYHTGTNKQKKEYTDWTDNLFKSTDKLEWWLNK